MDDVFSTDLPLYFDTCLVVIAILLWSLSIHSTLKLLSSCITYRLQKGIVTVLIPLYLITLYITTSTVSLIIFHEIEIHKPFKRNDNIQNIARIIGSYVILWLNFFINCIISSCWIVLFADLFQFATSSTSKIRIKCVQSLLTMSAIYFLIILITAILIEIVGINMIDLAILSYIHSVSIILNIILFIFCICKLPIPQVFISSIHILTHTLFLHLPLLQSLDLSIGLYQLNTKCSCFTRITRYIWSILMIAIAQILQLTLYICDIDIWNLDQNKNEKFLNFVTNNMALLMFFIAQLVILLWLWMFVGISIKQSRNQLILVNAIKEAMMPLPVAVDVSEHVEIRELKASNEYKMLEMPLNSPADSDESDADSTEKQQSQNENIQQQQHVKVLTEDEIDEFMAANKDNYDAFDPNNYSKTVVEEDNVNNEIEMQRIEEDEDAKSPDVSSVPPPENPNDAVIHIEMKEETPNAPQIDMEGDTTETEGESINDDQNVPSPPLAPMDNDEDDDYAQEWTQTRGSDSIYEVAHNETPEIQIYEVNDQQKGIAQSPITVIVERYDDDEDDSDSEEEESSGDEAENTEVRHYTDESESDDADADDDDELSQPNIVMKF